MTPKEKADELVKKMYKVHSDSASSITLYFAKQCALIAVDEIKEAVMFLDDDSEDFWFEVKQEIEKL
jgi:hypothetical protein